MDSYYGKKILQLVNNLYQTTSELKSLTVGDLKIYLVFLYVAKIDALVKF